MPGAWGLLGPCWCSFWGLLPSGWESGQWEGEGARSLTCLLPPSLYLQCSSLHSPAPSLLPRYASLSPALACSGWVFFLNPALVWDDVSPETKMRLRTLPQETVREAGGRGGRDTGGQGEVAGSGVGGTGVGGTGSGETG